MKAKQVIVSTVSRLHFGFFDLNGDLGRIYGSLGLALANPNTTIKASSANSLKIDGPRKDRIIRCLEAISRHYQKPANLHLEVRQSIPAHSGLGSGTQLSLAVAMAAAKILDIPADIRELSAVVDRGRRSGVGVAAFEVGGFVLDGGHPKASKGKYTPPPVIFRREFPAEWQFILALPRGEKGLSGKSEEKAIADLKPPKAISEEICRYTLLKLLPALAEKNIKEFGCALTEIDRRTGMFFQNAQDGIYSTKSIEELVGHMMDAGAYGAGQSSWGPAIYGLVRAQEAQGVMAKMKRLFQREGIEGEVFLAKGSNQGSLVQMLPPS